MFTKNQFTITFRVFEWASRIIDNRNKSLRNLER